MYTDRFAPSPTGELHLGHAYSALVGWRAAEAAGGRFLLRMEDLDQGRVRPEFVEGIYRDLAWLGIGWEKPVLFQSTRLPAYQSALERLAELGLTYRCTCTRRDIADAVSAPQEGAPMHGPDGLVYPGTCRGKPIAPDEAAATRLDMRRAIDFLGGADAVAALRFHELDEGPNGESGDVPLDAGVLTGAAGDVVLCRRDDTPAYHLAVVLDDAHQAITHVTRGRDLFAATPIHRLLQALLDLPVPSYRHHRLIRDADGRRLAKRDRAHSLEALRAEGWKPADIIGRLNLD